MNAVHCFYLRSKTSSEAVPCCSRCLRDVTNQPKSSQNTWLWNLCTSTFKTRILINVYCSVYFFSFKFHLFFLLSKSTRDVLTNFMTYWFIDWLVCCLLAGPDLWNRMLLNCSITMVFSCPLLSWCEISSPFRDNNKVVVFPFLFHIFMPLPKLWFIRLQG